MKKRARSKCSFSFLCAAIVFTTVGCETEAPTDSTLSDAGTSDVRAAGDGDSSDGGLDGSDGASDVEQGSSDGSTNDTGGEPSDGSVRDTGTGPTPDNDGARDHGSGSADAPKPWDLPARMAAAFCNDLGPCCSALASPYDPAQCRATILLETTTAYGDPGPDIDYDPVAADECMAAIVAATRACLPLPSLRWGVCRRIFIGHVSSGGECTDDRQCAPDHRDDDYYCPVVQTGQTRRCTSVPIHASLGESCTATSGPYSPPGNPGCFTKEGLYCNYTSRVCEPLLKLGSPCATLPGEFVSDCEEGAYCDDTRVCVPQRESGPCGPNAGQPGVCLRSTSYCDLEDYQCRPKRKDGELCGSGVGSCTNEYCFPLPPDPTGGSSKSQCGIGTLRRCQGHMRD
jgi:hypothetical protein